MASRRRLVRELGDGRLGYLHIPNMVGEGWADFDRDLHTENTARTRWRRGRSAGTAAHTSELVVEKLARRVIGGIRALDPARLLPGDGGAVRWSPWPTSSPGPTGDIVTAAVKLLDLGPVVGTGPGAASSASTASAVTNWSTAPT